MSSLFPDLARGKEPTSDTKREAPRRLLMFLVPLAIVAIVVLLLGLHHTGSIESLSHPSVRVRTPASPDRR